MVNDGVYNLVLEYVGGFVVFLPRIANQHFIPINDLLISFLYHNNTYNQAKVADFQGSVIVSVPCLMERQVEFVCVCIHCVFLLKKRKVI